MISNNFIRLTSDTPTDKHGESVLSMPGTDRELEEYHENI